MAGNLYKRADTWWARVKINGAEVRRSLRTGSRAEAKERAKALIAELQRVAVTGSERHTWRDAVVLWSQTLDSGGVKPSTAKRYQVSARALDARLGKLYLDQITRRVVGEIVSERKTAGASNATIRRDLTAMSRILAVAVASGWTDENPARSWDRSVIKERRETIRPPALAAIEAVAGDAPGRLADLIRFAALTGMRQQEAARLEWRDVDMQAGTVTLVRTKTSRPRVIRLDTPGGNARPVLERVTRSLHGAHVFWHGYGAGRPYAQVANRFITVCQRVAEASNGRLETFRFHDMRHAFAVRWLQSGGDIYDLSRHLGHSSVKTTEGYLAWVHRHTEGHSGDNAQTGLEAAQSANTGAAGAHGDGTKGGTGTTVLRRLKARQSV